jgi:hypothetical protein
MKKIATLLFSVITLPAIAQWGGVDTWRNYTVTGKAMECPDGWNCTDSLAVYVGPVLPPIGQGTFDAQIAKTTDHHGGTHAAKLTSRDCGSGKKLGAGMANASYVFDATNYSMSKLKGGFPITHQINYGNVWIKYLPNGEDTAQLTFQAVKANIGVNGTDSIIGKGVVTVTATVPDYTLYSVHITYAPDPNAIPDHIQVAFFSSPVQDAKGGTELYVDDVSLTMYPENVEQMLSSKSFNIVPNPAKDRITINEPSTEQFGFEVYSSTGQHMLSGKIRNATMIDISTLTPGLYFYKISSSKGELAQRGKFAKE